jgi:hypothetical protein
MLGTKHTNAKEKQTHISARAWLHICIFKTNTPSFTKGKLQGGGAGTKKKTGSPEKITSRVNEYEAH